MAIQTGILFGDIHSYYDLNLVLAPFEMPPAKPKTNYVDIPGADGSVDLTEANGETKYSDRECRFTFTMLPTDAMTWEEKKTAVSGKINGKRCKITLDRDDDYYYVGRCTVDEYLSNKMLRQIVISARVAPYKLKQHDTVLEYTLTGAEKTITIQNSRKSVSPTIETTADNVTVVFESHTFTLPTAGTYEILDILLVEGDNTLTVSGSGTITFTFQEGVL